MISAPNSQALNDALGVIEAKAMFDGPEHPIHVRAAEHEGNIYIDLADQNWRAVEVSAAGWRVIENPPVRFRRARAMLPLPAPVNGGSVDMLRSFLNVADGDWPLVTAWLLQAMRPRGPYPVLCLHGEQGSAKSTTARVLRSLVDPNSAPLRSEPREPRDLMIAANNAWVIALDNLSRVPVWLSDGLCRLSTGGGFSTRELYSDAEEIIFDAQRPIIITGIEELATRGDLLDRALLMNLDSIPEGQRRPESGLWQDFELAKASIFGAMLTAVSAALRNVDEFTLQRLPRMADFAIWATAGESALGLEPGAFMAAYSGNREAGNELALEASPVGRSLMDLMADTSRWQGTATELLTALEEIVDKRTHDLRSWPKTPQTLSGWLKRLAPNLRASGVGIEIARTRRRRLIVLARTSPEKTVTSVTSVTTAEKPAVSATWGDDPGPPGDDAMTTKTPADDAGDDGDDDLQPRSEAGNTSELPPQDKAALDDFLRN